MIETLKTPESSEKDFIKTNNERIRKSLLSLLSYNKNSQAINSKDFDIIKKSYFIINQIFQSKFDWNLRFSLILWPARNQNIDDFLKDIRENSMIYDKETQNELEKILSSYKFLFSITDIDFIELWKFFLWQYNPDALERFEKESNKYIEKFNKEYSKWWAESPSVMWW